MPEKKERGPATASPDTAARNRLTQGDMPRQSLRDALRIPQALVDNYAGHPTAPHDVALALDISPTSSAWRALTGAAQGYGLIKGGYNADRISLEPIGRRAVAPTEEGDDLRARAEAVLKPRVFGEFFRKYDRNKLPVDSIAKNVLLQQFGVPQDRLDQMLQLVKDNGQFVGFIRETKTGPFIAIDNPQPVPVRLPEQSGEDNGPNQPEEGRVASRPSAASASNQPAAPTAQAPEPSASSAAFKVFISHGKNRDVVEQVKDILSLYDIEYEVAIEEETAAIPVPQKVLQAMRRCAAGIMVVTADESSITADQHAVNNNVLIEIGAAFVLYDQRVVLLWDKRLKVPSNLQGLYRLEFEGSELSFNTGTKLAKAVKTLKR